MTRIVIKKDLNEPDTSRKDFQQNNEFLSLKSIICEGTQRHFNVLIWSKTEKRLHSYFPKLFLSFPVEPAPITFTFTYAPSTKKITNLVLDCLVFLPESSSDKEYIEKIISEYAEICIKIVIFPSKLTEFDNFTIVTSIDEFYHEFFNQHNILEQMLRDIFEELDRDLDGNIDSEEMAQGLAILNPEVSQKEIERFIKHLDLDHDGKIDFYEFGYWWRRGRQGTKRLKTIIDSWMNFAHNYIPTMSKYIDRNKINKQYHKKNITINIGELKESIFGLNLIIGKSAKREEILRDISRILELTIFECWIAFQIKYKNETAAKENLSKTEEMLNSIKHSILAGNHVGKDISDGINFKVIASGVYLNFSICFDITNDFIEKTLSSFNKLDIMLRSPLDDYIDIKIISNKSIQELMQAKEKIFTESIGSCNIIISSEHWIAFHNLIQAKTLNEILIKQFLELNNELILNNPSSEGLNSFITYLDMLFNPLKIITTDNLLAKGFFKSFGNEIYPELDLYIRYNNIGGHIGISCEDLSRLFINID